jgi:hypothetical protein
VSPSITEHKKTTTYDIENSGHGLGQAQISGGVTPVNGIPTLIDQRAEVHVSYPRSGQGQIYGNVTALIDMFTIVSAS